MEGDKKCFGLLLALSIMVGLSLSVFSIDTNALQYEFMGIPFLDPVIPTEDIDCGYDLVNGSYRFPSSGFDYDNCVHYNGFLDNFRLEFAGDSYDSSYRDLQLKGSSSYITTNNDNNYVSIFPFFYNAPNNSSPSSEFPNNYIGISPRNDYIDTRIWDSSSLDVSHLNMQRRPLSNFNLDSVPAGLMHCEPFGSNPSGSPPSGNGALCPFTWSTRDYISSQVLPYWYSSDGFYIHSKAISSDTGLSYSNTFSFYNMFNNYIPTFSRMTIPLWDYDNLYFANADNMYQGRHIDFNGAFEFDGSFEWHDNIQNNGSYFRINYYGISDSLGNSPSNLQIYSGSFDCNTNLITISGLTRLEYSCPFDLPATFNVIRFSLDISGNGNYVWKTDDEWRFAYSFLTTDNDDTPGGTFNSQLTGGGYIAGDAQNLIPDSSDVIMVDADSIDNIFANFTDYLSNLFVFNLFNPFGFIFNLFSDSNSCAQIPTLSGMLHSEETQVCPYFDSTVRNILTPVISIVSTMLLFGFILRWIRSSSSDFSPEVIGGK